MAGHITKMGRRRMHAGLVGKPERNIPLAKPRRRCVDNIKIDIMEVVCGGMDWIDCCTS
jgi:hypothetical protein